MTTIKTFSGHMAHGGQEKIYLAGGNSTSGYRIVKLMLIPTAPGVSNGENVVKIYTKKQTSVDALIDFRDDALLGAGYYQAESSSYNDYETVLFDHTVVNQDIYLTNSDARGNSTAMNYYLELEEVKMSDNEAAVVNFNAALVHT